MSGLNINIFEDGQVIHLDVNGNDCKVASVHNNRVIENNVSGNALNDYIEAFLDSVTER